MIPVNLLTGFLGAGKTSLLNRLLRAPELANALVIVNEWGEIGIDHLLIEKLDGDIMLLGQGCLCCALRGDLVEALNDLLARRDSGALKAFDRIIIETSGLADPAPILYALIGDPLLAARLRLAGVTTLIDAVNGRLTLQRHIESARQAASADLLAVSKSDLAEPAAHANELGALRLELRQLNPNAPILDLAAGELSIGDFLSERAGEIGAAKQPPIAHSSGLRSANFIAAAPISAAAFAEFMRRLRAALGPKLLRIKGLVALAERPGQPLVIQGAQHILHAPRFLSAWPEGDRRTRLVAITNDFEPAGLERLWQALAGAPEIDAPDFVALTQSPLVSRVRGLLED